MNNTNTTGEALDLNHLEALAKAAVNAQSVSEQGKALTEYEWAARMVAPGAMLELIALARRSLPVDSVANNLEAQLRAVVRERDEARAALARAGSAAPACQPPEVTCQPEGCQVSASPAAAVPEGALPPLPDAELYVGGTDTDYFTVEQMQAYARAAVEADRAQRPEHCRWPTCESEAKQEEIAAQAHRELYSGADRAQQGEPVAMSDEEIESAFKAAFGQWDGNRWVIEDADLHPFVRGILYRAATKAAAPADAPTDLPKRLRIKAGVMANGEKIAWGSDTELMLEAADYIERAAPVPDTGKPKYKDITDHNGKIVGVQMVNWDERPRYDRAPASTTPTSGEVEKAKLPLDLSKITSVVKLERSEYSVVVRFGHSMAAANKFLREFGNIILAERQAAPAHPGEG